MGLNGERRCLGRKSGKKKIKKVGKLERPTPIGNSALGKKERQERAET